MKIAFINGKIFTGKNENDFINEFIIKDGKFFKLGNIEKENCDKIIDLEGKTVIPALTDSHTHPLYVVDIFDSLPCTPPYVHSIDELIEFLKSSSEFGKKDRWIKGWCYDESKLKENRTPTIMDLDKVSTTQPIFVQRSDGHSCICNSRALELAGITKDTPEPIGGKIGRFEDGTPNGFMFDLGASNLIREVMYKKNIEEDAKKMVELGKHYAKLGITNLTDMMCYSTPYKAIDMYRLAREKGFKQRISIYNVYEDAKKNYPNGFGDDGIGDIKIAGIKFFIDGTLSSGTALVSSPYKHTGKCGELIYPIEDLDLAIQWAKNNNCQISIHVMGDRGIDLVLETTEKYENWLGDTPAIRIEHCSLISEKHMEIIKNSKVKYSLHFQPIFTYAELDSYKNALEDERLNKVSPLKSVLKNLDGNISISSDAPATIHSEPENIFVSIKSAVRRVTADNLEYNRAEEISVEQAILMVTRNPKSSLILEECSFMKEGYSADFIILDKDIFSIDKKDIDTIKVLQTYLNGELIYNKQ